MSRGWQDVEASNIYPNVLTHQLIEKIRLLWSKRRVINEVLHLEGIMFHVEEKPRNEKARIVLLHRRGLVGSILGSGVVVERVARSCSFSSVSTQDDELVSGRSYRSPFAAQPDLRPERSAVTSHSEEIKSLMESFDVRRKNERTRMTAVTPTHPVVLY